MDEILAALAAQHAELDSILTELDEQGWTSVSRCPDWSIADVVLHLAQTDEAAAASARGELSRPASDGGWGSFSEAGNTVDDGAAAMVDQERGAAPSEVLSRWRAASADARAALAARQPSDRVMWVVGDMAARTLATTRLAECWIHTEDVAIPLGMAVPPTPRLWHIARLAHRTLPYAVARAGAPALQAPVVFELAGPDGLRTLGEPPADGACTVVRGPLLDLCRLAGQRAGAADTTLTADGPDATAVLALVRTFA